MADSTPEFEIPELRRAVVSVDGLEIRDAADGDPDNDGDGMTLTGHAAVYNRLSDDLGGFREVIAPGAFDDVMQAGADVRLLFNHDQNAVLARTSSGTLQLSSDDEGLHVSAQIAPTSMGKDVAALIKRGDVNQMSFAFTVPDNGDDWVTGGDGTTLRTVNKVDALYDVSAVTYPAYPQTDANVRGLAVYSDAYTPQAVADAPIETAAPVEVTAEAADTRSELAARELRLRHIRRALPPSRA